MRLHVIAIAIDIGSRPVLGRDGHFVGAVEVGRSTVADGLDVKTRALAEIDRFNQNLDRQEKIRRFALLPRDFTIDDDEITPSMKVKRKMIDKKYKEIIDQLFLDENVEDEREGKRA